MTWFCFPGGWGCYDFTGVAEKSIAATGAHGYATKAQASKNVNASPTALQAAILQGYKAIASSPAGGGTAGDQAAGVPAGVQSTPSSPCIVSFPKVSLLVTSVGGGCLLSKTEVRALIGGSLLGAAALGTIIASVLIVAYGLTETKAGQAAQKSARRIGKVAAFAA